MRWGRHRGPALPTNIAPPPDLMRPGGLPPSDAAREQAARADLAELELQRRRDMLGALWCNTCGLMVADADIHTRWHFDKDGFRPELLPVTP